MQNLLLCKDAPNPESQSTRRKRVHLMQLQDIWVQQIDEGWATQYQNWLTRSYTSVRQSVAGHREQQLLSALPAGGNDWLKQFWSLRCAEAKQQPRTYKQSQLESIHQPTDQSKLALSIHISDKSRNARVLLKFYSKTPSWRDNNCKKLWHLVIRMRIVIKDAKLPIICCTVADKSSVTLSIGIGFQFRISTDTTQNMSQQHTGIRSDCDMSSQ